MAGIMAGGYKSYGAYYEGQQQQQYYKTQALLTERQKEEATRDIALQEEEAKIAERDAILAKQKADIERVMYGDQSDERLAKITTRFAKSGGGMSGSVLDYLSAISDERAYGSALIQWQGEQDSVKLHNIATIKLDAAKVAEGNLSMFDYQAYLHRLSASEAVKVAEIKQKTAEMESTSAGFSRGMSFAKGG
jgi:hypothetical protein